MDWDPTGLTPEERRLLEGIQSASSLSQLATVVGADSEHDAYLSARERWKTLREGRLDIPSSRHGVPGDIVEIDGAEFWVHGITHADTDAEREVLRQGVSGFLDDGGTVYCEQGIRPMYFEDIDGICEMDDYRWALQECQRQEIDSHVETLFDGDLEGISEQVTEFASRFREEAFSMIDSGSDIYGEGFEQALGDLASDWVTTHEEVATGRSFEAFSLRQAAAEDPDQLIDLQQYYRRTFLPQPLEREWLRRHDEELEIVTHGRNERMADYAVYHHDTAPRVHLIVGAAHQPGVVEYLRQHRDGERTATGFEFA